MPYEIEVGGKADAQLAGLDAAVGASVERKIQWLAENAAGMVHRRLVGMPEDLAGLCKLRVGDYRLLFSSPRIPKRVVLKPTSVAYGNIPRGIFVLAASPAPFLRARAARLQRGAHPSRTFGWSPRPDCASAREWPQSAPR